MEVAEEKVKARSSKNRRDWCKGKVGKQHDYEYQFTFWFDKKFVREDGAPKGYYVRTGKCTNYYLCSNCGRKQYKKETFNPEIHNKKRLHVQKEGTEIYERVAVPMESPMQKPVDFLELDL